MWFFTDHRAVQLKNNVWLGYGPEDGFLDGEVDRLYQAPSGALWFIGKHKGKTAACRYDKNMWRIFTSEDGLNDEVLYYRRKTMARFPVLETRNSLVYFGGQHNGKAALCSFDPRTETWTRYSEKDGLVGTWITRIYEASDGTIWVGNLGQQDSGYGLFRFDGKNWTRYTEEDGLSSSHIYGFAEWPKGTLWIGTIEGLNRIHLSDVVDNPVWWNKDDFPFEIPKVRNLLPTQDGLYFGFLPNRNAGIVHYNGEIFQEITDRDGLVSSEINTILQASDGAIWVASPDGLSRFDGTVWSRYTADDGLIMRGSRTIQYPTLREISDGTFWIDNLEGHVIHFNPKHFDEPETTLDIAVADQVSSEGNIHIKWDGVDKWNRSPKNELHYQWRLNNDAWTSIGNSTTHTFTNLIDGSHQFEVRAINRYGKTDPSPAIHAFIVESPWWKNPYVLGGSVLLLGLVGLQTGRVVRRDRRLQAANRELDDSNTALSSANNELYQLNEDLQQKTDDLTVEAALERVRAKALVMQSTDELSGVSETLFHEISGLGFDLFMLTVGERNTETKVVEERLDLK